MRDVTTTVYKFDELSEEAREQAIEHYRDVNVDGSFWHEQMTEVRTDGLYKGEFQEQAAVSGFEMTDFSFSGFYSQGDGASFEAMVEYETFILKNKLGREYRRLLEHVRDSNMGGEIKTSGHYYHANTMGLTDYDAWTSPLNDSKRAEDSSDIADEQLAELIEIIQEKARDLANDFYRTLELEFDYLTTDTVVIEWIEANEIEFTEEGEVA